MIEICRAFRVRFETEGDKTFFTIKDLTKNKIIIRKVTAKSENLKVVLETLEKHNIHIQYHYDYKNDIYLIAP